MNKKERLPEYVIIDGKKMEVYVLAIRGYGTLGHNRVVHLYRKKDDGQLLMKDHIDYSLSHFYPHNEKKILMTNVQDMVEYINSMLERVSSNKNNLDDVLTLINEHLNKEKENASANS